VNRWVRNRAKGEGLGEAERWEQPGDVGHQVPIRFDSKFRHFWECMVNLLVKITQAARGILGRTVVF